MTRVEADAALEALRDGDAVSESDIPGRDIFRPSGLMISIDCMNDRLQAVELGRPSADDDTVRLTPRPANFVPHQSGGVLAGIRYDNAAAEPNAPNGHALAQEAINAAGHFGNTTSASNRNTYYIIMSAHGTNPAYCAWRPCWLIR